MYTFTSSFLLSSFRELIDIRTRNSFLIFSLQLVALLDGSKIEYYVMTLIRECVRRIKLVVLGPNCYCVREALEH